MSTVTALPDPPSLSDPETFESKAGALVAALPTMVTEINVVVGEVNANASAASTAATTATTKAGEASADAASADADRIAAQAAAATATAKAAEAAASAALATGFLGQFQTLTTSTTLSANVAYQFASVGQNYTLPTGANGDTIILSNTGTDLANSVVPSGGQTIMGVSGAMTFDKAGYTITMKCTGSDWRIL